MTEEEAKTKWCPFIQVSAGGGCVGGLSNRQDGSHNKTPDGSPNCIGSACMAWRWREPPGPQPPDAPEPSDEGWCGLAGRP